METGVEIMNNEKLNSATGTEEVEPEVNNDDFQPDIVYDEGIASFLEEISDSLAVQISQELNEEEGNTNKKTKIHIWKRIAMGSAAASLVLLLFTLFLVFTPPGHKILTAVGGQIWSLSTNEFNDGFYGPMLDPDFKLGDESGDSEFEEIQSEHIVFRNAYGAGRHEDYVYNVLLLGEEAIGSGNSRGRTDVMMIATINTREKSVKLTSLMRDSFVQIPGYQDNKLNGAYARGGVNLIYETIAKNYDLRMDGCVLVNFENFEKIIDTIGGVEVTLTDEEAKYLNWANYISNPQYRNVVPGVQTMNGNQAVGYSRIRYRKAITGNTDDYGRTDRHRLIMNAIFSKYKDLNNMDLLKVMAQMLPMITTDISASEFEFLITKFLETGARNMEQLRLPIDGAYENRSVRNMDVLILDFEENIEQLHEFIFGKETGNNVNYRVNK